MKIAVFDDYRLALLRDGSNRDISGLVDQPWRGHPLAVTWLSSVVTLHPGDVYATGAPAGVGLIGPCDQVRICVDKVSEFISPVRRRDW